MLHSYPRKLNSVGFEYLGKKLKQLEFSFGVSHKLAVPMCPRSFTLEDCGTPPLETELLSLVAEVRMLVFSGRLERGFCLTLK